MVPKPPGSQGQGQAAQPALPTTTDFNALYNRISLAATKQNSFLKSMRSRYPSLQQGPAQQQPIGTASTTASSSTSKPGFSSLSAAASSGKSTTPQAAHAPETTHNESSSGNRRNPFGKTKAQLQAEQEDLDFKFEPANAGLGYRPSKADAEADAATRELGRRLLGKRGRVDSRHGGVETWKKAAARKRQQEESEEEEEEGRSGLGRTKKRVKAAGEGRNGDGSASFGREAASPTVGSESEVVDNAAGDSKDTSRGGSANETANERAAIDLAETKTTNTATATKKKKKNGKNKKKKEKMSSQDNGTT